MKVAVSIPDTIFAEADALARRTKQSRSRLYARALSDYVALHSPDEITALANALADEGEDDLRPFLRAGARTALKNTEW
ncbi:MAG: hypothetical protein ABIM50_08625 [Novosphingobium sp.]